MARENAASTPADARVISRAVAPQLPSFPKKVPIIAIATIAGLVLSLGLLVARELLSGRAFSGRRLRDAASPTPCLPRSLRSTAADPGRHRARVRRRSPLAEGRGEPARGARRPAQLPRAEPRRPRARRPALGRRRGAAGRHRAGAPPLGRGTHHPGRLQPPAVRPSSRAIWPSTATAPATPSPWAWANFWPARPASPRSSTATASRGCMSCRSGAAAIDEAALESVGLVLDALGETYDYLVLHAPRADRSDHAVPGARGRRRRDGRGRGARRGRDRCGACTLLARYGGSASVHVVAASVLEPRRAGPRGCLRPRPAPPARHGLTARTGRAETLDQRPGPARLLDGAFEREPQPLPAAKRWPRGVRATRLSNSSSSVSGQ